jgi:hypothetical protein
MVVVCFVKCKKLRKLMGGECSSAFLIQVAAATAAAAQEAWEGSSSSMPRTAIACEWRRRLLCIHSRYTPMMNTNDACIPGIRFNFCNKLLKGLNFDATVTQKGPKSRRQSVLWPVAKIYCVLCGSALPEMGPTSTVRGGTVVSYWHTDFVQ